MRQIARDQQRANRYMMRKERGGMDTKDLNAISERLDQYRDGMIEAEDLITGAELAELVGMALELGALRESLRAARDAARRYDEGHSEAWSALTKQLGEL